MLTFEDPNHHRTLARNIGVSPRKAREPNDEEVEFAKRWMELRIRAAREDFAFDLKNKD